MTYLDYNATTPVKPAVCAAVIEAVERYGNPSSTHRYGRTARRSMEEARAAVAALVGVKPSQVIFTSGGTEANNLALHGIKAAAHFVSAIEHPSVLDAVPAATKIPVGQNGVVDVAAAAALLASAPRGSLISLMLVNNETGVIQPVAEIAALAKAHGHIMHTDAVQAAGRMPLDFGALGVSMMTLSAHKIGGLQGVGALIVDEKLPLQAAQRGGGQEMGRRAGTENVPGIIGFGVAARLAADDLRMMPTLAAMRDDLQRRLVEIGGDDAVVVGASVPRAAGTLSIAMRGVSSETQVMALDLAGVAVSAGSACSSGKVRASHVLRAMGYGDDVAGSALRFSMGWGTEQRDIASAVEAWRTLYNRTRQNNQQTKPQSEKTKAA